MSEYRCIVNFQWSTNVPKDVMENVWYFNSVGDVAATDEAINVMARISQFYLSTAPSVAGFLAGLLNNQVTMRVYNMADAEPRPIIAQNGFLLGSRSASLPPEVALCMSYYVGRNLPSRRGRLFIGPLGSNSIDEASARPELTFINAIAEAGEVLIGYNDGSASTDGIGNLNDPAIGAPVAATVAWALRSPKLATQVPITAGWVDNEWDGQHRRRISATTRVLFS